MTDYDGYFRGKRVLVTGGAGCIGSNLVRALSKLDVDRIIVVDNFSSSPRWNMPVHPNVRVIEGDILDEETLRRAYLTKPDVVFHLAAHFANQNSIDHPETDLMVNGLGLLKVLQFSRLCGVEKFVFASSGCSVYGSEAPLPLTEDFVSTHLDTPYQITKFLGELYCNYFHDFYGLPVVIARYFNVYGPGELPGRYRNVIPNFIFWAQRQEPLPITGTGEETRDFTYVEDIVNGTLQSAVVDDAVGDAINLASGTETTVSEIAEIANRLTGNPAGTRFLPRRDWDKIQRRRASIDKARKLLGYSPTIPIREGIEQTVAWIKANWERVVGEAKF